MRVSYKNARERVHYHANVVIYT